MKNLLCEHCGKECTRANALAIHVYSCKNNPERKPHKSGYKTGYVMSDDVKQKVSWKGRKHSEASKRKISASRIKFLTENPDQVPYVLNHKSLGESYPEQYWKKVLIDAGISFKQEFRVSRYSIDFAIGNIALEIDGEQHYVDERVKLSDARRTSFLQNAGWKILRIRWSEYQRMNATDRQQFRIRLLDEIKKQS